MCFTPCRHGCWGAGCGGYSEGDECVRCVESSYECRLVIKAVFVAWCCYNRCAVSVLEVRVCLPWYTETMPGPRYRTPDGDEVCASELELVRRERLVLIGVIQLIGQLVEIRMLLCPGCTASPIMGNQAGHFSGCVSDPELPTPDATYRFSRVTSMVDCFIAEELYVAPLREADVRSYRSLLEDGLYSALHRDGRTPIRVSTLVFRVHA